MWSYVLQRKSLLSRWVCVCVCMCVCVQREACAVVGRKVRERLWSHGIWAETWKKWGCDPCRNLEAEYFPHWEWEMQRPCHHISLICWRNKETSVAGVDCGEGDGEEFRNEKEQDHAGSWKSWLGLWIHLLSYVYSESDIYLPNIPQNSAFLLTELYNEKSFPVFLITS